MNIPIPAETPDPNIDQPNLPSPAPDEDPDNPDGVPVQPTMPPTPVGDPPSEEPPATL